MAEAYCITLSQSLRDVIPMMQLLREIKVNGFPMLSTTPEVHCRAFEDNSGPLELALYVGQYDVNICAQ